MLPKLYDRSRGNTPKSLLIPQKGCDVFIELRLLLLPVGTLITAGAARPERREITFCASFHKTLLLSFCLKFLFCFFICSFLFCVFLYFFMFLGFSFFLSFLPSYFFPLLFHFLFITPLICLTVFDFFLFLLFRFFLSLLFLSFRYFLLSSFLIFSLVYLFVEDLLVKIHKIFHQSL